MHVCRWVAHYSKLGSSIGSFMAYSRIHFGPLVFVVYIFDGFLNIQAYLTLKALNVTISPFDVRCLMQINRYET